MRQVSRSVLVRVLLSILAFLAASGLVDASESPRSIQGLATYFTARSCQLEGNSGVYTASGERFVESALTCALPHRQFGGWYKVTNLDNGRTVIVRHNDLGPGRGPRSKGVIIDLTPAAFDQLGGKRGINRHGVAYGTMRVSYERVR